jgi:hypothetical protein
VFHRARQAGDAALALLEPEPELDSFRLGESRTIASTPQTSAATAMVMRTLRRIYEYTTIRARAIAPADVEVGKGATSPPEQRKSCFKTTGLSLRRDCETPV